MVLILLIGIAAACMVLEKFWPAAALPKVRGWYLRVALLNLAQLGVVLLAGLSWERWMQSWSLLGLEHRMGGPAQAGVAYLVSCLVYYGWHRWRHTSAFFWRVCHQIHHSPRRIEILTSFYKHPVEIALNSLLSSAIVYLLLGCSTGAAALYTFCIAVAEYFYHWNIRTPRWLGWIVQRPESHRIHHQYQRHTMNYADLPVIDWLFGTLENASAPVRRCGFNPRRERQLGPMLRFRDVHAQGPLPTCIGCRKRWACRMHGASPAPAEAS